LFIPVPHNFRIDNTGGSCGQQKLRPLCLYLYHIFSA
jgi:hypothetical protein